MSQQQPTIPPPPISAADTQPVNRPPAPPPAQQFVAEVDDSQKRGGGCLWGIVGALGCLVILALIPAVIFGFGFLTVREVLETFDLEGEIVVTADIVLERVQTMSQLTNVRYNYSSLVTSEREMPGVLATLYGERQIMVAIGHVNAGIDMGEITEEDVRIDGDTLYITLPPPSLHDCFLNEQASYVMSRDSGVFARNAPDLDTAARQFALQQFRDMALEAGILDEVQVEAQTLLQGFADLVTADNIRDVRIETTDPAPNAPLPDSCQ